MKQDWHNYKMKLERAHAAVERADISTANKAVIREFSRSLLAEGLTRARILKYVQSLRRLATWANKDLDSLDKSDILALVERLEHSEEYGEWSKQSYKVVLKRFFKWLRAEDDYPAEVRWLRTNIKKDRLRPFDDNDLITQEDVNKLVDAATHPRDKALVSVLWESGCRIGELGTLRIRDVVFDKKGCVLSVVGKTGHRRARIINATHYLSTWLACHPAHHDPESPVWVNIGNTNRGRQMHYQGMRTLLKSLFAKTGIKKKCNPHTFRHSRATCLAQALNEFQMNHIFGWVQGSNMPATYIHMTGKNTDDALLRLNGVDTGQDEVSASDHAKTCPRCESVNPSTYAFCGKCGAVLTLKDGLSIDQREEGNRKRRDDAEALLNTLLENKDVRAAVEKALTVRDAA